MVGAQEASLSQFFTAQTVLNPAYVGDASFVHNDMKRICDRFVMNYRNLWPELPQGFNSLFLSYDRSFTNSYGSFGSYVIHDSYASGIINHSQVALQYSYFIPILQNAYKIHMGIEAVGHNRNLNTVNLRFPDQFNPFNGNSQNTSEIITGDVVNYVDAGVGFMIQSPQFQAGYSLKNVVSPFYTFFGTLNTENRQRHILTLEKDFKIGNNPKLPTTFSFKTIHENQSPFNRTSIGGTYSTDKFAMGASFQYSKMNDLRLSMVSLYTGFVFDNLIFGISHDVNINSSKLLSPLGTEISLRILTLRPDEHSALNEPMTNNVF